MSKKQLLRELIGILMIWGSILYFFIVALIAVGSGSYMKVIFKGLIGLVVGWLIIMPVVIRKYL